MKAKPTSPPTAPPSTTTEKPPVPTAELAATPTSPSSTPSDADAEDDLEKGKGTTTDTAAAGAGGWRLKGLDNAVDDKATRAQPRERWFQLHRPKAHPPPAPASLDDAAVTPLLGANAWQLLTFSWITPLMNVGYRRTLQATDLWKMDPSRESAPLADRLLRSYADRRTKADAYNARLASGAVKPSVVRRVKWALRRGDAHALEAEWRRTEGRRRPSLAWSLNEGLALFFWTGGLFKVLGDTAQLMGPLVTRQIILFAQQRARHAAAPDDYAQPHIGRGVGMAFGLLFLTILASVSQHQFFWRSTSTGSLARASLTSAIYKISMFLTQKERTHLSNGKLLAHLSTDVSRIDFASQWFHAVWTAPIQLIITTILLILQIGPSAFVGIALFVLLTPVQTHVMGMQFNVRKRSMKFTDGRSRLLAELLGSFSIVKYFTLERPFLERISSIRWNELQGIRSILLIKAANQSIAMSLPTLAAVVSFLCYVGVGNDLNPANIFTALSLFQLLRQPLMFLPRALSAIADAGNALERLAVVFDAETLADVHDVDLDLDVGVRVSGASFEWLSAPPEEDAKGGKGSSGGVGGRKAKKAVAAAHAVDEAKADDGAAARSDVAPFRVADLNLEVRRGAITALVGKVGAGKSSILNALLGEMRKTSAEGKVVFGGRVAYCSQSAFIQNASIRDNVLFGQPFEEKRYWQAMADACLIADCLALGDADGTEVGEKGITISGGQKQRINVARALYYDADVVIFDDPLSAVDAAVSQALFQDAMVEGLRNKGKAVLLVTHALHILPEVDYIYTVDQGRVVEEGTYAALMAAKGPFADLLLEFGGDHADEGDDDDKGGDGAAGRALAAAHLARDNKLRRAEAIEKSAAAAGTGRLEGRLMVSEKRVQGKVSKRVYSKYSKAGRGALMLPLLIATAVLMQGSLVLSSVWLTWWQGNKFGIAQGESMGVYAALGVLQAIFTFLMGATMAILSFNASGYLHHAALERLFFAPMSLFNSTPIGRIMSIIGKDIDTIDNQLADSLRMGIMTFANVLGSTILIAIFFPYFLVAVAVILCGYAYFQNYYRRSAVEIKRVDSMLRSLLYGHFSESLTGLGTIRAYAATADYVSQNAYYMDLESRALQLVVVNQRWLAIRLDSLGAILSFVVGIMCVVGVRGITAAQVGLVLSFCITLTQQLGMITRQTAEIENNMNAVERVVHYADLPEQEAAYELPDKKPDAAWPAHGQVEFKDVVMSYRPDLPPVLKGLNLSVRGGEKIGIVGRTGAGKSSIMAALFRMVELMSGSISIDGVDVSTLGLLDLRSCIAMIPQDPQLYSGTIRSNLDPFSQLDDTELWSALRRAHLISSAAGAGQTERFHLDATVDEDGANFSVGQRSLLSLARALCKRAKIIVLDEATASVDAASDAQIQQTIATEFSDRTLLCIAHRLRTILHFDRILVLDHGAVAEVGTPLELFRNELGLFRLMALKSNISEADFPTAA